jgi:uncharacterized membrane protein HdeD (DUF308 family)
MSDVSENITKFNPWGWFLAYGVVSILMGWVLLARPVDTILTLAVFMGFYLLVIGIINAISSFIGIGLKGSMWGWKLAVSVLLILSGLFVLNNVIFTAVLTPIMFMYTVAFVLILNGVMAMVAGREDFEGNANWTWGSFILGALYVILGVMLLAADTFTAVSVLVRYSGWALVLMGFFNVVFSFIVKKEA